MVSSKARLGVFAGILCAIAVVFMCAPAPRVALADENPDPFEKAAQVDLADGEYSIDVVMEGGSGRASIASPALLTVKGGKAAATIQWSSPNYDYMLIEGEKYLPINEDPMANSQYQIPVLAFDEPFAVVGDTTAMSSPHEIDYTLTFALASVTEGAPATPETATGASTSTATQTAPADSSEDTSAPVTTIEQKKADEGGIPIVPIVIVVIVVIVTGVAIGVVRSRKNR